MDSSQPLTKEVEVLRAKLHESETKASKLLEMYELSQTQLRETVEDLETSSSTPAPLMNSLSPPSPLPSWNMKKRNDSRHNTSTSPGMNSSHWNNPFSLAEESHIVVRQYGNDAERSQTLATELHRARLELQSSHDLAKEQQREIDQLKAGASDLDAQFQATLKQKSGLIGELTSRIELLEHQKSSALALHAKSASQVKTLTSQLLEHEHEKSALQQDVNKLKTINWKLETEIQTLLDASQNSKGLQESYEMEKLEKENSSLTIALREAHSDNSSLKALNETLKVNLQELSEQLESLSRTKESLYESQLAVIRKEKQEESRQVLKHTLTIKSLQDELKSLKDENKALAREVRHGKIKADAQETEARTLGFDLSQLKELFENAVRDETQLEISVSGLYKVISSLEANRDSLEERLEKLTSKEHALCETLLAENQQLKFDAHSLLLKEQQQVLEHETIKRTQERRIAELSEQLEVVTDQLRRSSSSHSQQRREAVDSLVAKLRSEHDKEIDDLRRIWQEKNEALATLLGETQSALQNLSNRFEVSKLEHLTKYEEIVGLNSTLESTLAGRENVVKQLQEDLREAQREGKNRIRGLEDQVLSLTSRLTDLNKKSESVSSSFKTMLTAAEETIASLKAHNESLVAENARLQDQLTALKSTSELAQSTIALELEKSYTEKMDDIQGQLWHKEQELTLATQKASGLRQLIAEKEEDIESMEVQFSQLISDKDSALADLQANLKNLKSERALQSDQNERLQKRLGDLERTFIQQEEIRLNLEKEVAQLTSFLEEERSNLRKVRAFQESKKTSLETEVHGLKNDYDLVVLEVAELEGKVRGKEVTISELLAEIEDLNGQLGVYGEQRQLFEDRLAEIERNYHIHLEQILQTYRLHHSRQIKLNNISQTPLRNQHVEHEYPMSNETPLKGFADFQLSSTPNVLETVVESLDRLVETSFASLHASLYGESEGLQSKGNGLKFDQSGHSSYIEDSPSPSQEIVDSSPSQETGSEDVETVADDADEDNDELQQIGSALQEIDALHSSLIEGHSPPPSNPFLQLPRSTHIQSTERSDTLADSIFVSQDSLMDASHSLPQQFLQGASNSFSSYPEDPAEMDAQDSLTMPHLAHNSHMSFSPAQLKQGSPPTSFEQHLSSLQPELSPTRSSPSLKEDDDAINFSESLENELHLHEKRLEFLEALPDDSFVMRTMLDAQNAAEKFGGTMEERLRALKDQERLIQDQLTKLREKSSFPAQTLKENLPQGTTQAAIKGLLAWAHSPSSPLKLRPEERPCDNPAGSRQAF